MAFQPEALPYPKIVIVQYEDLVKFSKFDAYRPLPQGGVDSDEDILCKNVLEAIGQAFGNKDDCLGIIAVAGVPKFAELRQLVLPMAQQLANLPSDELEKITVPSSCFSVGWSHGKEKLAGPDNPPDLAKGSFYANPFTDDLLKELKQQRQGDSTIYKDSTDKKATGIQDSDDALNQLAKDNPAFFAPNVWPTASLPQLEGALKELGKLIGEVGTLLARPCDVFVRQQCPSYSMGKLENVLSTSRFAKARLLHYFPLLPIDATTAAQDGDDTLSADWCAWHKDHGSLTGLVPAMYLDQDGCEVASPDPSAGLYIQTRGGPILQVQLPPEVLAFQLGETSQIHTGGILRATPHAVRGPQCTRRRQEQHTTSPIVVTRETLAVFLEPEFDGDMDLPCGRVPDDIYEDPEHLPPSISPIQSRWKPGQNFGEFSNATFAAFY